MNASPVSMRCGPQEYSATLRGAAMNARASAAALASDIGDTYEKVIAEKGPPKSQMEAGAIRILSYPDATIKIKDNVVVSIKAVIAAPAQPTAVPRPAGQEVSPTERIAALKRKLKDALARIAAELDTEHTRHLVKFIESSERGICRE